MKNKSVVSESNEIQLAIELIHLGARLQVLETETGLSRERLLKLYKEIKGESPAKGMLPFSADWFMSWQPNIHASLFANIRQYLIANSDLSGVHALIKSYRLYLEHVHTNNLEPILTLTRAWTLVRFLGPLLETITCKRCGGNFMAHRFDINRSYVCGLCRPPSRAGKSKKHALELKHEILV
ncbi:MAG: flagellar transcriptional regulator FlhC [Comamonadaceae bacterium]